MALVKCRECGNEVSSKAKACQKCGAPPAVAKRTSPLVKVLAIVVGVGVIAGIAGKQSENPRTPAQQAQDEAGSKRFALAMAVSKTLKKAAREPDSLKFESMRVSDDASVACAEYRAKNGFGGTSKEFVVFVDGKGLTTTSAWNKHCTKPMHDQLLAVN